jgi:hypothetical protein
VWNGLSAGLEVVRVAKEIPTVRKFARIAEVVIHIVDEPRLAGGNGQNSVDLPALQQLAKPLLAGNGVTGLESKPVPRVIVAAAILRRRIGAVLRESAETAQRTVVETMTVGASGRRSSLNSKSKNSQIKISDCGDGHHSLKDFRVVAVSGLSPSSKFSLTKDARCYNNSAIQVLSRVPQN